MYVCMYVCICVCVYIYIYAHKHAWQDILRSCKIMYMCTSQVRMHICDILRAWRSFHYTNVNRCMCARMCVYLCTYTLQGTMISWIFFCKIQGTQMCVCFENNVNVIYTHMHVAGHTEILKLLLQVKQGRQMLCVKDNYGQTALHQAAGTPVTISMYNIYIYIYIISCA